MALIKCNECGKEISDKAQTCPHCGNPIHPVIIEKTGKGWKLAKLISVIILILGLLLFSRILKAGGLNDPLTWLGFCLALIGFISLLASKFGAWWYHK